MNPLWDSSEINTENYTLDEFTFTFIHFADAFIQATYN